MLTDYQNKVLLPKTKDADICPSCKGKDWKTVAYGPQRNRRRLVCKRCGHVKEVSK